MHKLPDYSFYQHIVLYNKDDHSYQARLFKQHISKDFRSHKIELKELKRIDERDLNEVQEKVGAFVKKLKNDDVTIPLSTGTGILKIAWCIFATSFQQSLKLIQYRANHHDFAAVHLQKSSTPYALTLIGLTALIHSMKLIHFIESYDRTKPEGDGGSYCCTQTKFIFG